MANSKDKIRSRSESGRIGLRAVCAALSGMVASGLQAELSFKPPPDANAIESRIHELEKPPSYIWQGEEGGGYGNWVRTVSMEAGGAYGPAMLGGLEDHHLVLMSISYGHMVFPLLGEGHWWRGNFEARLELFGGVQFSPDLSWIVGVTPHVRYNFGTGSRWIPFVNAGAGFSLTGIGSPDLGNLFEFVLQMGGGVHWHLRDDLALTFETRYMHMSNAGMSDDNFGLNAVVGLFGVTRFF